MHTINAYILTCIGAFLPSFEMKFCVALFILHLKVFLSLLPVEDYLTVTAKVGYEKCFK